MVEVDLVFVIGECLACLSRELAAGVEVLGNARGDGAGEVYGIEQIAKFRRRGARVGGEVEVGEEVFAGDISSFGRGVD